MIANLLLLILIGILVIWRARKDPVEALGLSLFLLVSLPQTINYRVAGHFDLQSYRVIVVLLTLAIFLSGKRSSWNTPLFKFLLLVAAANLVSTMGSVDVDLSVKKYLAFTVLPLMYFAGFSMVVSERAQVAVLVRYAALGIVAIAAIGVWEHFSGYNPALLFDPGFSDYLDKLSGRATSTYPHPILFGCGLAMGLPFLLYEVENPKDPASHRLFLLGFLLCASSIYFTFSRGAWLSAALAMCLLLIPRTRTRKLLLWLMGGFGALMILLLPGVLPSIQGLKNATFQMDTVKGSSYAYRWELWSKAWEEINKDPQRLLLGYGDSSHGILDLQGELSYTLDKESAFLSWDNEFAVILLERGIIGFVLFSMLVAWVLLKSARASLRSQDLLAHCIFVSLSVYVFMMFFVKQFSPQLNYLFMGLLACVGVLDRKEGNG